MLIEKSYIDGIDFIKDINILIIDDDDIMNHFISTSLVAIGFKNIHSASNLEQASTIIQKTHPELILLDLILANDVSGLQLFEDFKGSTDLDNTIVIVITGSSKKEYIKEAYSYGCVDYIKKPTTLIDLETRIALHFKKKKLYMDLENAYQEIITEQETAKDVFQIISQKGYTHHPGIRYISSPLATFNGDIFLVSISPSGLLYVMLGDFTGHGLSAALGAIPTANIFYTMIEKDLPLNQIILELNNKLNSNLPRSIFCAAIILAIDPKHNSFDYWTGGIEGLVHYNTKENTAHSLQNRSLALGVTGNSNFKVKLKQHSYNSQDKLFLLSDGLLEMKDNNNNIFGMSNLLKVINKIGPQDNALEEIIQAALKFAHKEKQTDDQTLMEISLEKLK